jgi:hypothetical protein
MAKYVPPFEVKPEVWKTIRTISMYTAIVTSLYVCGVTSAIRSYIVPTTKYEFESIRSKVKTMSVDELRYSRRQSKELNEAIHERYVSTMQTEMDDLRSDDPTTLDKILKNDKNSMVRK